MVHRKLIIEEEIYSPINNLYNDEEICEIVECDLFENIKPYSVVNLNNIINDENFDFETYIRKYKNYIYKYIYENKTLEETIKSIEDINRFYYLSLDTTNTFVGLILYIIYFVISSIMLLSIIFIFIKKYENHFNMLRKDFWILSICGCIILISSIYGKFGETTSFKCHLERTFVSFGFMLSLIPIFYKLITNFPEINKISNWINEHRYKFLTFLIVIDLIFSSLLYTVPYNYKYIFIEDGENFKICQMSNTFGKIILVFLSFYEIFMILCILFLIFIEWNLKETYFEARFFLSAMCIDILSYILYFIINSINIKNYIGSNLLLILNIMILSISNYICIYGIKIIHIYIRTDEDPIEKQIKRSTNKFIINKTQSFSCNSDATHKTNSTHSTNNANNNGFIRLSFRLFDYHYRDRISNNNSSQSRFSTNPEILQQNDK